MVYLPWITYNAEPAQDEESFIRLSVINGGIKPMNKKILICAVIALILIPASVMAVGYGGMSMNPAYGQGKCLQDGQNCRNQTGFQESGAQAQYRYYGPQNGSIATFCSGDGQCTVIGNRPVQCVVSVTDQHGPAETIRNDTKNIHPGIIPVTFF